MGDVFALEDDPAMGDVIAGKPHQGHHQARLARSVGAEEDVGLTGRDFHVDVSQDRFAADLHSQFFDCQHDKSIGVAGCVPIRPLRTPKK